MTTVYNIFKNAINEAVNFNLSSSESIEKTLWFNLTTKKPEIVFSAGSFEKLLDTDAYTPQGEEKVREMMIMLYDFFKENKIPITPGFEREYFSLVSENRRKREPYLRCIVAGDDAIDKIKLCVERLGFENLNSEYKKEDIDNAIHVLIYYFNTCRQREQKLMEEDHKMQGYPFTVIAVDFDGTIIKRGDFPKAEHPIPGAVEALRKFMSVGKDKFRFVLWSSRDEKDTKTNCYKPMIEFIEKNGLKFDAINDNIKEYKDDGIVSRKIIADCYIDDLGYPAKEEQDIIDMWKRIDNVAQSFLDIYGTKEQNNG